VDPRRGLDDVEERKFRINLRSVKTLRLALSNGPNKVGDLYLFT
jgi:hypothetical protein